MTAPLEHVHRQHRRVGDLQEGDPLPRDVAQGSLDVVGVVAAVVEAGYRGPLSLEVFSDIVREAPAADTARDAMRSLLYLEEALGARWADPGPASLDRPAVELFEAARVPDAPDAAYVEIDQGPSQDGARLLAALGLAPDPPGGEGWWRSGGALVRLTEGAADGSDEARRGLSVVGLGVAVDHPLDVAARADALGWPVRRPVDAPASVTSPTGVTLFPVERAEPGHGRGDPATWLGIDHVGAAVDADRSDAEVSFYRTLLGLRPGPVSEFFDPVGRLRSRSSRSAGRSKRACRSS